MMDTAAFTSLLFASVALRWRAFRLLFYLSVSYKVWITSAGLILSIAFIDKFVPAAIYYLWTTHGVQIIAMLGCVGYIIDMMARSIEKQSECQIRDWATDLIALESEHRRQDHERPLLSSCA
jgi:hypothetical protein